MQTQMALRSKRTLYQELASPLIDPRTSASAQASVRASAMGSDPASAMGSDPASG
jgi:hypothetical protein